MTVDSDRIPDAQTLSVRDDGIVRVIVLRAMLESYRPGAHVYAIQIWHQRIDRNLPPRSARCLMVFGDSDQGRQAAESLADHLAGMA